MRVGSQTAQPGSVVLRMNPATCELWEERAAIVEEGCKVDQETAGHMALQQMGLVDIERQEPQPTAQRYAFKFE